MVICVKTHSVSSEKMEDINIKVKFGLVVRERRLQLHMTQEELAEITGLHRTYISEVERGERNISLENISKISSALQISLQNLFRKI